MNAENSGWDIRRQNLLLSEFGLETLDGGWDGPSFEEITANLPDADLIEMFSIVTGVGTEEVHNVVDSVDAGNWKSGYVRLFISHSALHKQFVGEVAEELAVVGIHGFVAHDTMAVSQPWQAQIEQALRSMQAFVAIIHEEFNSSAWCQQEVGWTLGRRVPKYVVRMGADPAGFIGHEQWPSAHGHTAKQVAALISAWASSIPELSETMTDGLFAALEAAGNYMDAGATAERIANLSGLTEEQWIRLDAIFWENDQIHTGYLPSQALKPFYQLHHREWPPPNLSLPTAPSTAATKATHEPPF